MMGYLLNFYKFSPTNVESMQGETGEFVRSIVWSTFDRLEVRKITKFEEYRLSKFSEKNWLGERQFAMIYELDNQYNSLVYKDNKTDECEFVFDSVKENTNKRFFGVTLIDFTPEMHCYFYDTENPGKAIHTLMKEVLNKIINNNSICQDDIAFEIYGILGGQDVVIIWLSNQFDDIAKVIEGLRKTKTIDNKLVIANIYTTIGLKNVNNQEFKYDDIRGRLHIKLTKRDSFDSKIFEDNLKKVLSADKIQSNYTLFGEHDLMLSIDGSSLMPALYKRDGIFNSKSPDFNKNFIQSKTEITIDNEYNEIKGDVFPIEIPHNKWKKLSDNRINEYTSKINEIVKSECFLRAPYLQETLWLLYEDYMKNIMSSFSYPWSSDLDFQFENCLNYIYAMVESNLEKNKKYKNIHKLVSSMRQMMLHVAQANRIFFEIPNTHLKHTGAYSKILHTYYGVVKQYLKLAYSIPKIDRQSPVIPFISFDVTPIATSEFCDKIKGFNNNIVRIELPYEALVDISKYIKLLAHEIYHYIAPYDRVERNMLVAGVSFSAIMGQMVRLFIEDQLGQNKHIKNINEDNKEASIWEFKITTICKNIQLNILKSVNLQDVLMKYIQNYNECDEWTEYFFKFSEAMVKSLKHPSAITELLYKLITEIKDIDEDDDISSIVSRMRTYNKEDFDNWITAKKPVDRVGSLDADIRYSLREALADHFMIQATGMSIEEYINYVYEYQELVSGEQEHVRQSFRIAIIIEQYLGQDIRNDVSFDNMSVNEIYCKIFDWFGQKYQFEDKICEWLGKNYTSYAIGFDIYKPMFDKYFEILDFKTYNDKDIYPEFCNVFEEISKLMKVDLGNEFDNNIRFIEEFQDQEELRGLEKGIRLWPAKYRNKYKLSYNIDFDLNIVQREELASVPVSSLEELINSIQNHALKIRGEGEKVPIWFRGHESYKYLLIPSLYRMQNTKDRFYNASMRFTLKSLVEIFKAKAYNAPELIGNGNDFTTNSLITMQHYSVPTNILDWTTSAFVAMYFALEKEISAVEKKVDEDAVIYILNPIRLNIAREMLCKTYEQQYEKEELKFPISSLVGDDAKFEDYLPLNKKEEAGNSYMQKMHTEYPIAVYAPFVNQRIKAQLGTFVMFGLDNKFESVIENGEVVARDYTKCSLTEMQNIYKELCEKNNFEYNEFLGEVRISADAKKEIADSLRILGIDKVNIYPELDNISDNLTKELKTYFNLKNLKK